MKFKTNKERAEQFILELKYLTEKYRFYIDIDDGAEEPCIIDLDSEDMYCLQYDDSINQYSIK